MGSMSKVNGKKNTWKWQGYIKDTGKSRDQIYFQCNGTEKNTIHSYLEKIVNAHNVDEPMPQACKKWLVKKDQKFLKKLAKVGLYELADSRPQTLHAFSDKYFEGYCKTGKKASHNKLRNAKRLIQMYFDDIPIHQITALDVERFYGFLIGDCEYSQNHANRTIGLFKQYIRGAIKDKIISDNPFDEANVSCATGTNEDRHYYVDIETTDKILAQLNSNEWRLRFTLMRFLGLRVPSELNAIRIEDVNLETRTIKIHDSKREHHATKKYRFPVIPPEVLPYLKKALQTAREGQEYLLPVVSHKNLTARFVEALDRSGIKVWPQLFVNLRRSCITDADEIYPTKILDEWYGNSEKIRRGHYLLGKDQHTIAEKARESRLQTVYESPEKVTQIVSQKTEESSELRRTRRIGSGYIVGKTHVSRFAEETKGTGKRGEWAMRDSDRFDFSSLFALLSDC